MATFLLDSSIFSLLMHGHPQVFSGLRAVRPSGDHTRICPIVRGEILYGIERLDPGRRRQDLQTKAEQLFRLIPCESIPEEAGDEYAKLKVGDERHGWNIDENDLWIAATARALGWIVVASDQDFKRIPGLPVQDWSIASP